MVSLSFNLEIRCGDVGDNDSWGWMGALPNFGEVVTAAGKRSQGTQRTLPLPQKGKV
jgi:hypothetical protein